MGSWVFEVFYDGDCPLCLKEINMLRRMDREKKIVFTDIASETFFPESTGRSMEELMARIHGRLPDGSLVEGVDVFRHLYTAVGLGPVVSLTRLPGVTQLLDFGYLLFAKHRLKITGRCSGEDCRVDTDQEVRYGSE